MNAKGASREHAMRKAVQKMNEMIEGRDGYISDIYTKTIVTPLPGRVYTTIIASINEEVLEEAIDANTRRERIRKIVELLNNDPTAINVAKVAEVFGVSRTMIYKDLEALGFKRAMMKGEE
ncbi:MAG: HTH domain-containing protein [Euryarchaeota archaeon]|nr:HTH domain-containing protein [Euryarchaeota archaeon]